MARTLVLVDSLGFPSPRGRGCSSKLIWQQSKLQGKEGGNLINSSLSPFSSFLSSAFAIVLLGDVLGDSLDRRTDGREGRTDGRPSERMDWVQ